MKTTFSLRRFVTLLEVGVMFVGQAFAQRDKDDADKTLSPYFVVVSNNPETDGLPLKATSVKTDIVGSIADVTVSQVYVNTGKHPLEAIYTFPMSTRAAVYAMQMRIGDRRITAKIEEKKKARADYEKAKQEGKRASLLEQSRPNVFTMNVSNIMPGDTIEVELHYTELLVPENGVYSFVYPTVVGPRYSSPKQEHGTDDGFVNTPYTHAGEAPTYTFGYELTIHAGMPIQNVECNTHKMIIDQSLSRTANVTLDPSEKQGGNRDVVVRYSLRGSQVQSGVLLYEGKDENFFLAMVQPPQRVKQDELPPREYVFIVDVSGSMWGFPMEVSKKLMRNLVMGLKPTDLFNVVLFSSNLKVFSPTSVAANEYNIERAMEFIAGGNNWSGTEVLDALKKAYALPRADEDIARTFAIITDGYVDVEKECFEMIRSNGGSTNFFAFGIGSGVNRYLIEGMANAGGGEPFVVTKENEAASVAERFRRYIETPVLTRIRLDAPKGMQVYEVEPAAVPDMMAERPILIYGKYYGKAAGTLSVSGKVGRKGWKQSFDLAQLKADTTNAALRYLWARERIKRLDYLVPRYGGDDTPEAKAILALGLKYNLMTNYTSFIAIDEQVVNKDGKQTTVKQPVPMPEGVSDAAVGYEVATVGGMGYARGEDGMVNMQGGVRKSPNVTTILAVEEEEEETEIFTVVESEPEFPGGMDSLFAFVQRNIRYPEAAWNQKIEGKVYVTFTVETDGSITNIKVLRDIGGGCGQEAVRVVSMMPKWKPGTQRGKPVRVQYNLPIVFQHPSNRVK